MFTEPSKSSLGNTNTIVCAIIAGYDLVIAIGWIVFEAIHVTDITPAPLIITIFYAIFILVALFDLASKNDRLIISNVYRYVRYFVAVAFVLTGLSFLILYTIYVKNNALGTTVGSKNPALLIIFLVFGAIQVLTSIYFTRHLRRIRIGKSEEVNQARLNSSFNSNASTAPELSQLSRILELQNSFRQTPHGSFHV